MRIIDIYPVRHVLKLENDNDRHYFLNNYFCLTLAFDSEAMSRLEMLDMINEAITGLSTYNVNYDLYYVYDRLNATLEFLDIFSVKSYIKYLLQI